MDKNFLAKQRNALKSKIARRRIILWQGRYHPVCAICDEGMVSGCDMHEVFFTRGDLMKSDFSVIEDSVTGKNCVLVCPGGNTSPCHAKAATKEGQRKCINHLIAWEGPKRILRWLRIMNKHMTGNQGQNAIRLYKEVYHEGEM